MKRFQVIRTHLSPYQRTDFVRAERNMVLNLPGLDYQTLESFKELETILVTNTHTRLSDLPPQILKQTVLIVHPNSGYDHFASDHKLWKDIPVVIGHSIRAQAVAEYCLGALFEGLLEMPQHLAWNETRRWDRQLLKESNVWIFGYGHIGKIIADTLATLGMKVTIIDPYTEHCPHKLLLKWEQGEPQEARVIISALGLNSTTEGIFNQNFFSKLSDKVLFINAARGKLVNEEDLKTYLLDNPQSFAFLDVFEKEPFAEEWHGFPQIWKTSHIAGVEKNLDEKILHFEQRILKDFISLEMDSFYKKYEKELLQNKWIKGELI